MGERQGVEDEAVPETCWSHLLFPTMVLLDVVSSLEETKNKYLFKN